jgi:putative sigma-54 modulation protein
MKINLVGQHYEVSEELDQYVRKKLDKLTRYVPPQARRSLHAEVFLREHHSQSTNPYECEIMIRLPHGEIVAKEATINMYAAVDIVEAKLRNQLRRYKEKAVEHDAWRSRIWRRWHSRGR